MAEDGVAEAPAGSLLVRDDAAQGCADRMPVDFVEAVQVGVAAAVVVGAVPTAMGVCCECERGPAVLVLGHLCICVGVCWCMERVLRAKGGRVLKAIFGTH